jgi:hypothetical protein
VKFLLFLEKNALKLKKTYVYVMLKPRGSLYAPTIQNPDHVYSLKLKNFGLKFSCL